VTQINTTDMEARRYVPLLGRIHGRMFSGIQIK
jgi:hypothetical protein